MTATTFTTATGRLVVGRAELVALAGEVGADRVRGLDGRGLLHVGVDGAAALVELARRGLDESRADLLGSEAAWVRQRLALLRLDRPGERAVLVLRHEGRRVDSHLLGAGDGIACQVSAVFDPDRDRADPFVIEDVEPEALAGLVWRATGLTPAHGGDGDVGPVEPVAPVRLSRPLALGLREAAHASTADAGAGLVQAGLAPADASALVSDVAAGPLPLVRVVSWHRHDDVVTESALAWMAGADRLWLIEDRADAGWADLAPATEAQASQALAATIGEAAG
jgi:hypothetical protein